MVEVALDLRGLMMVLMMMTLLRSKLPLTSENDCDDVDDDIWSRLPLTSDGGLQGRRHCIFHDDVPHAPIYTGNIITARLRHSERGRAAWWLTRCRAHEPVHGWAGPAQHASAAGSAPASQRSSVQGPRARSARPASRSSSWAFRLMRASSARWCSTMRSFLLHHSSQ